MSEYNIIHIGYRRYICKENEDPISAEEIVGRLNELEQRLAAAEATQRPEPVRNIEKIGALITELRDCRKRGLGGLWDLCETAADQIEAIVAGDWS